MNRKHQSTYQNPQIFHNSALNPNWSTYPTVSPNFPQIPSREINNSYQKYYSIPIQNSFNLLENNEQPNFLAPINKNTFTEVEKY